MTLESWLICVRLKTTLLLNRRFEATSGDTNFVNCNHVLLYYGDKELRDIYDTLSSVKVDNNEIKRKLSN